MQAIFHEALYGGFHGGLVVRQSELCRLPISFKDAAKVILSQLKLMLREP